MKKLIFLLFLFFLLACQVSEDRCGIVIQKVEIENSYYFVLQTDEYINYYNTPSQPNLPDDGVRQGLVSKEIYDKFEIGDEYCAVD